MRYRYAFAGLLSIAAVLMVRALPAPETNVTATYSHGILHVTIPHSGDQKLTVEVLDPDDRTIGRADGPDVKLAKPLAVEDLVWHRVRYRVGATEGIESISQILRTPVLHVVAQQSYVAGA